MAPDDLQAFTLFHPYAAERLDDAERERRRFVHYTSADVAMSIIKNRSVWMRNAMTMNDFSEIQHGFKCLAYAWGQDEGGKQIKGLLDEVQPGLAQVLENQFDGWLPNFQARTYVTCISEHRDEENEHGRLSMWRAYGGTSGVALVINSGPFMSNNDKSAAYSSPVAYLSPESFAAQMRQIAETMAASRPLLARLGATALQGHVFSMLTTAMVCTKHPGFGEELEWRVVYNPDLSRSAAIVEAVETVRGVPQIVQKLPLVNDPDNGLEGAALPDLLEKVIIGPTDHQTSLRHAFVALLQEAGVPNAHERITISGIPLRHS
ncbi:MAG: hypothetical protein JWP28_919 [Phenylobacterium sp.]|uniref:DUF2971 domain-containing protein n=1 Tax=Phenylobacterium sp. TaxID=1871053 RepID=UPI00261A4D9A|nr:DUF2971 domain-containing protein [Phenylobacterium sp.]MDB5496888.1 hypothetical protein [Phenylobacterium sp.]